MARLTILIAFVAALVLVVHTSAFRDEQSCKKQLQHSEKHQEDCFPRIKNVIGRSGSSGKKSEKLGQCCEILSDLSEGCQCRALQPVMEKYCYSEAK
ncbi:hypothetical protein TanjilG_11789 [Lupinus angustifolius]|uniref:Conglutin delta 4 n=1 Tax=Lupinus angustifolius TaxID=3871 RepID=COND4_LUPAN|nr:conglutin delta 4 precursor [Lupinus angustifolius]F5B8X1.1 RecName: Full=Conglutin delta 4; AltName: Allergen=Lup an delta-conglutin; Flags: Precursor [Lupinus angustifolius]AEB33724.1 conglutin delta 4 [Lupinus angustifolius]OIW03152.1 hypothetical protein TanjilG_11789 [Lupinus angustifolius]